MEHETAKPQLPGLYDYVLASDDESDCVEDENIWNSDSDEEDPLAVVDLTLHDLNDIDVAEHFRNLQTKRWRDMLRKAVRDYGQHADFATMMRQVNSIHAVMKYAGNVECPIWEEFDRVMGIYLPPLDCPPFRLGVMRRLAESIERMKHMLNVKLKLRASVEQAYCFRLEMEYVRCRDGREMPRAYHSDRGNELDRVVRATPLETVLNMCFAEGYLGPYPRSMLHAVPLPRMHPDAFAEMALWIPEDDGADDDYAFGIVGEGDSRRPCKCADDWSVPFWILKHFLADCVDYALFFYRAAQRETDAMQVLCRSDPSGLPGMSFQDTIEYLRIVPANHPTYSILTEYINGKTEMDRKEASVTVARTTACKKNERPEAPSARSREEKEDGTSGNCYVEDVTLYKLRCVSLLCYHVCNTEKAFKSRKGLALLTSGATETTDGFECSICFRSGLMEITTKCLHKFCSSCLIKWVVQNHEFLDARCPLCRSDLYET